MKTMNREKLAEMRDNFINGNRSDVARWLDAMVGQRSAFAAVKLYKSLPRKDRAGFCAWLKNGGDYDAA